MNVDKKTYGPRNKSWWTSRRVMCIVLVLAATVYVVAQPKLEQWFGIDLPDIVERDAPKEENATDGSDEFKVDPGSSRGLTDSTGFKLKEIGRETYQSPAGLVYTKGPREHRIDHVMLHSKNDRTSPVHGVFDARSQDELLALLDEAYKLVKSNASNVKKQPSDNNPEYTEYTIDMPDRIGYVGGKQGAAQNSPGTKRMKLILRENRVITAYPTWPPRRH